MLVDVAGRQRKIPVIKVPFTIGRGEHCDAAIPDPRMSRLHAELVEENGDYFVMDAGSRHGTFVNGARCTRTKLKKNDEITFGAPDIKATFLAETPVEHTSKAIMSQLGMIPESSDLEKLKLFLEAAGSLNSGAVIEDVLRTMLEYALRLTCAERAFLYVREEDGEMALSCGLDAGGNQISGALDISLSVVREAMSTASEFIVSDATQQSALAQRDSILLNRLRTVIAIPLRMRQLSPRQVAGVLYLDSHAVSPHLHGVGHHVLRALASECGALLESAKLVEAEAAARQYRQELEIAASIQRSLLSESEVQCDFARVSGRSQPCKEVGGDFFDIHVSPGALTVVVADVSGKGISAALLASVIHGMFYAQLSSSTRLPDAVASINKFLCSRVAGQKYATLMAAQLRRDGKLEIVNCGHVPALIAGTEGVIQVNDGDLPLGLLPDASFHSMERHFPPGSRLCIITDGISEAQNTSEVEFGLERVQQCLAGNDPATQILTAVSSFCGDSDPQDDCTVIILDATN